MEKTENRKYRYVVRTETQELRAKDQAKGGDIAWGSDEFWDTISVHDTKEEALKAFQQIEVSVEFTKGNCWLLAHATRKSIEVELFNEDNEEWEWAEKDYIAYEEPSFPDDNLEKYAFTTVLCTTTTEGLLGEHYESDDASELEIGVPTDYRKIHNPNYPYEKNYNAHDDKEIFITKIATKRKKMYEDDMYDFDIYDYEEETLKKLDEKIPHKQKGDEHTFVYIQKEVIEYEWDCTKHEHKEEGESDWSQRETWLTDSTYAAIDKIKEEIKRKEAKAKPKAKEDEAEL